MANAPLPWTVTLTVQLPGVTPSLAGIVPPARWIVCCVGNVTVPPQVLSGEGVAATTTPFVRFPGRRSSRATLTRRDRAVLVSVMVNLERPLGMTIAGEKALLTVNPVTSIQSLAGSVLVRDSFVITALG